MDQNNPLARTDATGPDPAAPPRRPRPPRVAPFGGSKWAAFFAGPREAPLAARALHWFEPGYVNADGTIADDVPEAAAAGGEAAFWAPTGEHMPLGALLTDILPAWLAAQRDLPDVALTGPALSTAEAALLTALDLHDRFLTIEAPTRFARLAAAEPLPAHLAPADADALALLERLRPPTQPGAPAGLAILPRPGHRFSLRNQASVTAWLRARRIAVLDPDHNEFSHTAALLSAATLVLIAEPAQAGLLAFCQPETRIVELAAEGWAGARTRTLCAALGLNWRLFLGGAPTYPITAPLPFGAPAPMAFEISIGLLNKALSLL